MADESAASNGVEKRKSKAGRSRQRNTRVSTDWDLNLIDWKLLTKEECLERVALIPPGLDLFDITRAPRTLEGGLEVLLERKARLSNTGLIEDLSCPICMGTYQNVSVVKDCLHRFCGECIERWLRTGRQDCPQCRNRIPSRRSLRADPIFERIVRRLFPDVENYEQMNDRAVAAVNQRKTGIDNSVFLQQESAKRGQRATRRSQRGGVTPAPPAPQISTPAPQTSTLAPLPSSIKIVLTPDPNQPKLKRLETVILSPAKMISINQLNRMVGVAAGLNPQTPLEFRLEQAGVVLSPTLKLSELLLIDALELRLFVCCADVPDESQMSSSGPSGKHHVPIDADVIPKKSRTSPERLDALDATPDFPEDAEMADSPDPFTPSSDLPTQQMSQNDYSPISDSDTEEM